MLHPFQIEDIARAGLRDGALIAWEPGMGKTHAALAWHHLKAPRRSLIVAPGSLHLQFQQTASAYFPGSTLTPILSQTDFFAHGLHLPAAPGSSTIYLTTYTALGLNRAEEWAPPKGSRRRRSSATAGIGHTSPAGITCIHTPTLARLASFYDAFDCVILDEGTKIQSSESKIARSIRVLSPRYRLVLTGTPVKNRLDSIFWLAAWAAGPAWPYPHTEAAKDAFLATHLRTERNLTREETMRSRGDPVWNTTTRSPAISSRHLLWKTLAPVIIRRTKTNCGTTIPPKSVQPIIVPPGQSQFSVYRFHLDNPPRRAKRGGPILHRRLQAVIQLNLLRQATLCPDAQSLFDSRTSAQGPRRSWTPYTPKHHAIAALLRDILNSGGQAIIGSPYRHFSHTLHTLLAQAGVPALLLDGQTTPAQRATLAADFKRGRYPVLIAGVKAMGEGHSFENCSHLILPGLSYAYDENEQFIHRVWRINSPRPITIHPILTAGTIDIHLADIFREKSAAASIALDGDDGAAPTAFTNVDFEIDAASLIATAKQSLDPHTETLDEALLLAEWDAALQHTLRLAALRYTEHHPFIVPTDPPITALDMAKAREALGIPCPTQITINVLRKQNATGNHRPPPDPKEIARKAQALRNKRKKP